jgi:hypothetical protein
MMSDEVRLKLMEVDEGVVMCNAATARRFCARGNNEVLLQRFFLTPLYCANRCVWMTEDSHCFSEEEDGMTQAP